MKKYQNLVSAVLLAACTLVTMTGKAQNTTSTLPSKAKLVTVEYPPAFGHTIHGYTIHGYTTYTIHGYVYKKQFVEGQELEIIHGESKITGTYNVENGTPIVRGKMVQSNSETVEGGVFQVTNDVEKKQLIAHVKKVYGLDVYLLDFFVYSRRDSLDIPLTIQKISDDNYEASIDFPTRKIKSHVNQSRAIELIKTRNKPFTGYGEISYNNGDIYSGKIYDNGEIYFDGKIHIPNEGLTKFADGTEVEGDWLSKYNFSEKVWRVIYDNSKNKYPTEIRNLAIAIQKELEEVEKAKQKELEEQEKARLLAEQKKNKLKNYVDDYIKKHTVAPAPQGEFETMEEWQKRVYKEKDEQKRKLMNEALRKLYGDNPFHEKVRLRLGQYNIDKGYFPMTTNGFGSYALSVSKGEGPWWREQWDTGKFTIRSEYGLVNGEPRLVYLEAKAKDQWGYVKINPIDEKTGKLYEFIWEDGVWKEYEEEEEEDEDIYGVVEEMPQFPGGNVSRWIALNVKYPPLAMKNGIQGKVFTKFVIEKDGSITNVQVARGVDASLDKEAVRVIKSMPRWKPGKSKGKLVRVSYTLPINFQLTNGSSKRKR